MRGLSALAIGIFVAFLGEARGDGPPVGLVPTGGGWHCFQDGVSGCYRSYGECEMTRDEIAPHAAECTFQSKAAVLTFFDIMKDQWRSWATSSMSHCRQISKFLRSSGDARSISKCVIVGKRPGSTIPFNPTRVPGGAVWFCTVGDPALGSRGAREEDGVCFRSGAECISQIMGRGECKEQVKALALSISQTGVDGLEEAVVVFSSLPRCNAARGLWRYEPRTNVSPCREVGAVARRPFDPASAPPGSGWYCYVSKDSVSLTGTCARTEEDCELQRGSDVASSRAPGPCETAPNAFAVNIPNRGTAVYPTAALCEQEALAAKDASACGDVP